MADGGTVGGARAPYGDKVLTYLAPGEEVITNRNGEADRFRADRALIEFAPQGRPTISDDVIVLGRGKPMPRMFVKPACPTSKRGSSVEPLMTAMQSPRRIASTPSWMSSQGGGMASSYRSLSTP